MDYKQECLKINKKLKLLKDQIIVTGIEIGGKPKTFKRPRYSIIYGNKMNNSLMSEFKSNPEDAWKSCYDKLTQNDKVENV